jgi:hypothetical protein
VLASPWKSFLTHPHLVGVLLRCRWRASGSGVPFVNFLFRSLCSVVRRRLLVAASSAFCVKVVELDVGFMEEGWLGLTRASLNGGGHSW